MSAWTNGTYTHKGLALLSKLTQGSSLKITQAVAGTGYVTPENLAKQTSVSGLNYCLSFMSASYPETGTCKLPVVLTNKNLTTGYYAKQIGLFANDPDEGEILYFIVQSAKGTEVPAEAETPGYSATWNFYFQYGQADNVFVNVDPSHTVTTDMLEEVRAIAESGVSSAKGGVIVRNDNAAALPFAGLKLFGKTTQDGTPTPDNPHEFVNIKNPTITSYGKNILKPSGTKTQNGVTLTLNEDGTYTLSGTATGYANVNIGNAYVVAGRKYKPTVVVYSGSVKPAYWNFETQSNMNIDSRGYLSSNVDTNMSAFIFNDKEGVTFNAHFAIMLELVTDSETGVYEPYKEERTLTVKNPNGLNGIPVSSGGNYTDENGQQWICDEVDFARGVYIQRVYKLLSTYDSGWTISGWSSENHNAFYRINTELPPMVKGTNMPVLSTHFAMVSDIENVDQMCVCGGRNNQEVYYMVPKADFPDAEAWTQYVQNQASAGTPITTYYVLATPIETTLTELELCDYAALTANNPVTTVINDAGAWMVVDLVEAQHENGFRMASSGRTVESVDYPGCFYRVRNGEVEWLNPPMMNDVEYRTADRWQNYAVYTKLLYFSTLPNTATTENITFATSGVRGVLHVDFGVVDASGGYTYTNIPDVTCSAVSNISDGSAEIAIKTNSDMSKYSGYVVVRYIR